MDIAVKIIEGCIVLHKSIITYWNWLYEPVLLLFNRFSKKMQIEP